MSKTPRILLLLVWPLPRSLATTSGISVDFSSSAYLDVSVQRVPPVTLWIYVTVHGLLPCGFPHSEICGSKRICHSPQHIAACHVLHRLLVPRHSPCALSSLTYSQALAWMVLELCGFSRTTKFVDTTHIFMNRIFLCCSRFVTLFSFQSTCSNLSIGGGLKWTRTIDLALIRRAL